MALQGNSRLMSENHLYTQVMMIVIITTTK